MLDFGYYNMDCMEGMKEFTDKYFDIAIVDPPYFKGPNSRGFYGRRISPIGVQRVYKRIDDWEIPTEEYFNELARVSKHQIVWGVITLIIILEAEGLYGINAMTKQIFRIVKLHSVVCMIQ